MSAAKRCIREIPVKSLCDFFDTLLVPSRAFGTETYILNSRR